MTDLGSKTGMWKRAKKNDKIYSFIEGVVSRFVPL